MKNSHTEALKEIVRRLKPVSQDTVIKDIVNIAETALADQEKNPFDWQENYFAISVASHPIGDKRASYMVLEGDLSLIATALAMRLAKDKSLLRRALELGCKKSYDL